MRKEMVLLLIGLTAPWATLGAERPYITPVNYPTPVPDGSSVSGTITNIDPVNKMIQVREPSGMVQTVHIDDHVQILRNSQPINLNTLSLGDSITVTANE